MQNSLSSPSASGSRQPDYLLVTLRNWRLLVASAVICALAAAVFSGLRPSTYESSVTLLIHPPLLQRTADEGLVRIMDRRLPMETYHAIATSPGLLAQVIDVLGLEDTTVEDLMGRSEVDRLELRGVRDATDPDQYSYTMTLAVRSKQPEEAANIAETWARLFQERMNELTLDDINDTVEVLEDTHTRAREALLDVENELEEFQKNNNVRHMQALINEKEGLVTSFESQLARLEVDLAAEDARLSSVKAELEREDRIDTLFRAPPDEVFWLSRNSGSFGNLSDSPSGEDMDIEELAQMGFRTELLNPNFTAFREEEFRALAKVAAHRSERENLQTKLASLEQEIREMQNELVVRQLEERRLEREVDTHESIYNSVSGAAEMSKMLQARQTSDIHIASPAIVPQRPVQLGAGTMLNSVVAALVGLLIALGYIVVREVYPDAFR